MGAPEGRRLSRIGRGFPCWAAKKDKKCLLQIFPLEWISIAYTCPASPTWGRDTLFLLGSLLPPLSVHVVQWLVYVQAHSNSFSAGFFVKGCQLSGRHKPVWGSFCPHLKTTCLRVKPPHRRAETSDRKRWNQNSPPPFFLVRFVLSRVVVTCNPSLNKCMFYYFTF